MEKFVVTFIEANKRLDKVLLTFLNDKSRTYIAKLVDEGHCLVNGKPAYNALKVKENDVIELDIPPVKPLEVAEENIPLDIIYEDDDILIINKPQGMVVHPANGHHEHTLVNAIKHHTDSLSNVNGDIRPGIVHRIDKDTSGLICVAKNDDAHRLLSEQLSTHTMARTYVALVKGVIKENSGTIDMPIGRDEKDRQKMAVTRHNSKEAITNFTVLERYKEHTLIECHLVTGRTHQIRVHMAEIGYPVEGDPLYSGKHYDKLYKNGQLLCAIGLKLIHPKTKEEMQFKIDLPDYFLDIIKKVK